MTSLFVPGDHRAGPVMTGPEFLGAMATVESRWLDCLVAAGIAPTGAARDLHELLVDGDDQIVASAAEGGGNPVIPLLDLLRERLGNNDSAAWLHRGLTSQDVLDSAMMLCLKEVLRLLHDSIARQVAALVRLADANRRVVSAGRTLTQFAVPVPFGLKAANWLTGVLDASDTVELVRSELPVQVGGAAGTMAALTELATGRAQDPAATALSVMGDLAVRLGLAAAMPWHTSRRPITRVGDALVTVSDACGRIATDVLTLSRPEIGELTEDAGGGSSTMPHKHNPVLSILIKRAAISAPPLSAQLHTAAALAGDERPDGAWHSEWSALHQLSRTAVIAAAQTADLVTGLHVAADRMVATATAVAADLLAERSALRTFLGVAPDESGAASDPGAYLGASDRIIDAVLARARTRSGAPW